MNGNALGMLAGVGLLFVLGGLVIGVLVYALVLMLAHKLVAKSNSGYGKAILTSLAIIGASIVVGLILGLVLGWLGLLGRLVVWVVNFLVAAWLIQKLMKPAGGSEISYGLACGVEAVAIAISIVIALVIAIIGTIVGFSFMHVFMH